jgi:3-isopropylmalate dehydrogenase
MMLSLSLDQAAAADAIERAVDETLRAGWRTPDLADASDPDDGLVVVGTTAFATAVVEALEAGVPA